MVLIVSALIGAVGTVLSAAIAVLGYQVKQAVDGQMTELQERVKLLELVLSTASSTVTSESDATQGP